MSAFERIIKHIRNLNPAFGEPDCQTVLEIGNVTSRECDFPYKIKTSWGTSILLAKQPLYMDGELLLETKISMNSEVSPLHSAALTMTEVVEVVSGSYAKKEGVNSTPEERGDLYSKACRVLGEAIYSLFKRYREHLGMLISLESLGKSDGSPLTLEEYVLLVPSEEFASTIALKDTEDGKIRLEVKTLEGPTSIMAFATSGVPLKQLKKADFFSYLKEVLDEKELEELYQTIEARIIIQSLRMPS